MVSKIHHNNHQYLKKVRGLYDIPVDEAAEEWDRKRQNISNLNTLSLFNRQGETSDDQTEEYSDVREERPITPINDSVKVPPKTYQALSKFIYRRIHPREEWNHISVEDQSSLGGVIMGEVNAVWPVLRRQVDDPFLTQQQNRELQRRIAVHIVSVCEQLFLHYSAKIKILNARKVFSNPANLSRIRAQLSLDAGKYLNILDVRRHIILDLKKPQTKDLVTFNREDLGKSPTSPSPPQTQSQLSFRRLVESSRPKRRLKYKFNLNAELHSMKSQMPSLNIGKVQQLLPLKENAVFSHEDPNLQEVFESQESVPHECQSSPSILPVQRSQPKTRCPSEPLPKNQLLLDELVQRIEDDLESTRTQSREQSDSQLSQVNHSKFRSKTPSRPTTSMGVVQPPSEDTKGFDPKDPQEDLRRLIAKQERAALKEREGRVIESDNVEEDIPPLIQAITRREAQNVRFQQLKIQEEELDEKHRKEDEERRKPLPEPLYPQPVVVQTKLPAQTNPVDHTRLTIRMSEVKINERVDLSSVTLDLFLPIYNDLTGEISQATVKELDSNLFQGGELREVYSEIMKTVPNVHQRYDDDPLIVVPPTNVDLTRILASSTLTRPRSQQVINPKLRQDANHTLSDTQLQDMLMEKISQMQQQQRRHSMYPASDVNSCQEAAAAFNAFTPSRLNASGIEKGTRAYASWLAWWKNTINTDDYFKYMSTQDTDFLSVLFHFYDSEAGDSDSETSMRTAKLEAQRERERKLSELKKEKEEYLPGLWNVKTVMLGGLGKDPEIEEDKEVEVSQFKTPDALRMSQSQSPTSMKSPFDSEKMSGRTPRSSSTKTKLQSSGPSYGSSTKGFHDSAFIYSCTASTLCSTSQQISELSTSTSTSSHSDPNSLESSSASTLSSSDSATTTSSQDSNSDSTLVPSIGLKPILRKKKQHPRISYKRDIYKMKSLLNVTAVKLHASGYVSSVQSSTDDEPYTTESTFNCKSESVESSVYLEASKRIEFAENNIESSFVSMTDDSSGYYSETNKLRKISTDDQLNESSDLGCHSRFQDTLKVNKFRVLEDIPEEVTIPDEDEAVAERSSGSEVNLKVRFADKITSDSTRKKAFRSSQGSTVGTMDFVLKMNPSRYLQKLIIKHRSGLSPGRTSIFSKTTESATSGKEDVTPRLSLQERLEIVWRRLKMTEGQKLDFALKYSTDDYIKKLSEIVLAWERVTDLILAREENMRKLEIFEKEASDPNRFFERGYKGSSVARLWEAKERAGLYKKLEKMETMIKPRLLSIKRKFFDVVSYNGRPYLEKMCWDRMEMLYWLQQERRAEMLRDQGQPEHLELFLQQNITIPTSMSSWQIPRRHNPLPLNSVQITIPK